MTNKHYPLLLSLFLLACGSKQAITVSSPGNNSETSASYVKKQYYTYRQDTFNFLVEGTSDSSCHDCPLQVVLKMETAKIGSRDYSFYQSREFKLDKESEFINFDNVIGIKFFRTSTIEYGQYKNYYKYQVMVNEKGIWKVGYSNNEMRELSISKKRNSNLSREGTTVSSTSDNLSFSFSFSFLKY